MYSIFFLSIVVFILLLLFFKQIKITKSLIISALLSAIILFFIIKPQSCIDYTLQGLNLFMKSVFPTIFPFLVICNMLIAFNGINIYSKLLGRSLTKPLGLSENSNFALVASIFCGYPIGARYSAELYEEGYISTEEFNRLINIASNSGPIFTIGALGVGMMNNKTAGIIIMISCYISAFLIGIIIKPKNSTDQKSLPVINKKNPPAKSFGTILKDSVSDGINGIMIIGGYIILFSIIINIIKDNNITKNLLNILSSKYTHANDIYGIVLGTIDLTNGCNIITTSSSFDIKIKACIISFFCAFGSLSVVAQVNSFLYKFHVNMKRYIVLKLVQGIISCLITFIIFSFIPTTVLTYSSSAIGLSTIYIRGEVVIIILLVMVVTIYKLFHVA